VAQLTDAGLEAFDAFASGHVDSGGVPGVAALVAHGDQVHTLTRGVLSFGGSPVERDSLFRIASMTKPVTAATTLALVGEGLLDLDEPVDRLLPELSDQRVLRHVDGPIDDTVPADRATTARDLLTFTFGFGFALEMFSGPQRWPILEAERASNLHTLGPPHPELQPPPDVWIAALGALPLLSQPGERWLYNTGASVLGVLCSRAAGAPFDDVMATRVFEPLKMPDTSMWTQEVDRLATAYVESGEGLSVLDPPDGAWSRPPAFPDGAGGLVSTVDDMLAFANLLLRGGEPLLSRDQVREMTTNHLSEEQREREGGAILGGAGWGFCQAVVIEGPRAGAFGWTGGLGTSWLVDPVRELVVIVLTQRMFSSPTPPAIHEELQAAVYAALQ
jgi:CubicO group peptidase (beta-lactamase class C family)